MSEAPGPRPRARRAVPLIAVAVLVILGSGAVYLRTANPVHVATTSPAESIPVLRGPYAADYDFFTPALGWALIVDYSTLATEMWIFQTADGAQHWRLQFSGRAEGARTYIHFFDHLHGFAYAGFLYRTVDGGAHWEAVDTPGSLPYVGFATPTQGWAMTLEIGAEHLYRTVDGGLTWTQMPAVLPGAAVPQPIYDPRSLSFRATGEGWLGAGPLDLAIVYLTADGGASWRSVAVPYPPTSRELPAYFTVVRLIPEGGVLVFVTDQINLVLATSYSSDRGASWRPMTFPVAISASADLSFIDQTHWMLLRTGQVYRTADAGATWTHVSPSGLPANWSFVRADAIDDRNAWWSLVSTEHSNLGALALTSDGGAHWRPVNVPQP
jgi:photosystem II stability/assembly factor-like uncharacterized protein